MAKYYLAKPVNIEVLKKRHVDDVKIYLTILLDINSVNLENIFT